MCCPAAPFHVTPAQLRLPSYAIAVWDALWESILLE